MFRNKNSVMDLKYWIIVKHLHKKFDKTQANKQLSY